GAEPLEKMIELSGGEEHLLARAKAEYAKTPGVPPLLAELNPRLMKAATRGGPLTAPEIQPQLIQSAQDALDQATKAKQAVGAKYEPVLSQVVPDPAASEILRRAGGAAVPEEERDAGGGA